MRFSFLLFIVIPLIELYLLFMAAEAIGGLATFMLVLLTAALGIAILRRQGGRRLWRIDQRLQQGQPPGQEIFDGMFLSMAAVMLILPGLISDTLGVCLLLPPVRRALALRMMKGGNYMFMGSMGRGGFQAGGFRRPGGDNGDIIEGEVVDRDDMRRTDSLDQRDDEYRP